MEQIDVLLQSLQKFWDQLATILPKLLLSLLLLTVGWIIAKVARKTTIRLLRLLRVDVMAEKSGIEDFLLRGDVKFTTVSLLASLIYWTILFTVMLAVLNSMGLEVAAQLFNKIILYLPNVAVAVIVLIFGAQFAKFIQSVAFTYLSNIGISGAEVISLIAQYSLLFFVFSVALEQLQIGGQILVSAFQIAFGALCLGLALAFGLGGKEWASSVLNRLLKK